MDHGHDGPPPENPGEALAWAHARMEREQAQKADALRMRAEYTAVVVRGFFDGLNDDQLTVLTNLLAGLSNEGKHNYMTSMLYGMAIASSWHRAGKTEVPDADIKFMTFAQGIDGMLEQFGPGGIQIPHIPDLTDPGPLMGGGDIPPEPEEDAGDGDSAA